MTDLTAAPALFVVACPACAGWSTATAAMAGEAACCPQCAAAFLVPQPAAAPNQAPPVHAAPAIVAPAIVPTPGAALAAPAPVEPAQPASVVAEPLPSFEIPDHGLAPQAPDAEMQFREPVKTVGHGPNAIELRRLTPEEKEARRRRRNIIMLLTGAAILIAIAVVLGFGPRR
jgi:hypothetical protein